MTLSELAQKFRTDKRKGHHGYVDVYDKLFQNNNNDIKTLVEIGIGGKTFDGPLGASLRMWKKFFKNAIIIGVDNDPDCLSLKRKDNFEIIISEQDDVNLKNKINKFISTVDLIIDDASHIWKKTETTFYNLFELVTPGGYYIIEDIHCTYEKKFNNNRSDFDIFIKKLMSWIDTNGRKLTAHCAQDFELLPYEKLSSFEQWIESIVYSRGLLIIKKRNIL